MIDQVDEYDLAGMFRDFSLREIIDFLNNGNKSGALQVEVGHGRISFFVADGRLQGAVAAGIDPSAILQTLPESLRDLAPVLNMTVGGRIGAEMDGLVELLDRKVLDPRLLRMLLRHQATMLVRTCFTQELSGFRFECGKLPPPLYRKLPLDISLAALLVDGAMRCDENDLPDDAAETVFVRRKVRGQNLVLQEGSTLKSRCSSRTRGNWCPGRGVVHLNQGAIRDRSNSVAPRVGGYIR